MRIGLFGGTFDPIHLGHLRTVLEVREALCLDRVYLIPSAVPPHKRRDDVSAPADRLEMLQAAVGDDAGFVVSRVEFKRTGPSYTIDTVRQFQTDFGPDHRLHLIMGLDAFLEFDTWKSFLDLVSRVALVVMLRPTADTAPGAKRLERIRQFVADRLSGLYAFSDEKRCFFHPDHPPIQLIDVTAMSISSTRIRRLVRERKSIRFLVPDPVERIIRKKGLYL
jgi:nicotinate-nucleotide adenylyltransferase